MSDRPRIRGSSESAGGSPFPPRRNLVADRRAAAVFHPNFEEQQRHQQFQRNALPLSNRAMLSESALLQQHPTLAAAARQQQQQEQAAAMAFATDIRAAALAASQMQHHQDPQLFSHESLLAQQLGLSGAYPDPTIDLLRRRQLEELQREELLARLSDQQRRQLLAGVSGQSQFVGAPFDIQQRQREALEYQDQQDYPLDRQVHLPPKRGTTMSDTATRMTNESAPRRSGQMVFPCRAEDMPIDHNSETAYFVIDENTRHGEKLLCSHLTCRMHGIKFRYCLYCNRPVAQNSFAPKHAEHHHGPGSEEPRAREGHPNNGSESASLDRTEKAATSRKERSDEEPRKKARNDHETKESSNTLNHSPEKATSTSANGVKSHSRSSSSSSGTYSPVEKEAAARGPPTSHEANKPRTADRKSQKPQLERITDERMSRWASLLRRRPLSREGEAMSAWLMEVLAVSDLEKPLEQSGAKQSTTTTTHREQAPMKSSSSSSSHRGAQSGALITKKKRRHADIQNET